MPTYYDLLVICILFTALLVENEANHCGCLHKKTNKRCIKKSSTTTTTTPTPSTIAKCAPQACFETEYFCFCGKGFGVYPLPASGNCDDVANYCFHSTPSPDTSPYLVCTLAVKNCNVTWRCYKESDEQIPIPTQTSTTTLSFPETCKNVTESYCICGSDDMHYPVPNSGNCEDVIKQRLTTSRGLTCYKMRTVCMTECSCNWWLTVDPTIKPTPKPTQNTISCARIED